MFQIWWWWWWPPLHLLFWLLSLWSLFFSSFSIQFSFLCHLLNEFIPFISILSLCVCMYHTYRFFLIFGFLSVNFFSFIASQRKKVVENWYIDWFIAHTHTHRAFVKTKYSPSSYHITHKQINCLVIDGSIFFRCCPILFQIRVFCFYFFSVFFLYFISVCFACLYLSVKNNFLNFEI